MPNNNLYKFSYPAKLISVFIYTLTILLITSCSKLTSNQFESEITISWNPQQTLINSMIFNTTNSIDTCSISAEHFFDTLSICSLNINFENLEDSLEINLYNDIGNNSITTIHSLRDLYYNPNIFLNLNNNMAFFTPGQKYSTPLVCQFIRQNHLLSEDFISQCLKWNELEWTLIELELVSSKWITNIPIELYSKYYNMNNLHDGLNWYESIDIINKTAQQFDLIEPYLYLNNELTSKIFNPMIIEQNISLSLANLSDFNSSFPCNNIQSSWLENNRGLIGDSTKFYLLTKSYSLDKCETNISWKNGQQKNPSNYILSTLEIE